MNEITVFKNEKFGEVKTIEINGIIWFIGVDIAKALGYANPRNAVPKFVSEEDKQSTQIEYAGQKRNVTIINESGLYSLIFSSKLENAKEFKHWVTSEVLPSIRKTGSYGLSTLSTDEIVGVLAKTQSQVVALMSNISEQVQLTSSQVKDNTSRIEQLEKKVQEISQQEDNSFVPSREHIVFIIKKRSLLDDVNYSKLYDKLFAEYKRKTKENVVLKAKEKDMTTLSYIEQEGGIPLLYSIAKELYS